MNLSQQIAKIDGKCACEKPDIEQPLQTACFSCNKDLRPDYLVPENLYLLMDLFRKIVADMEDAVLSFGMFTHGDLWHAGIIYSGESRKSKDDKVSFDASLSNALIAAIIEAKDA